jgi:hypothetical protein
MLPSLFGRGDSGDHNMSAFAETENHFAGSNKLFLSIWIWLLMLTGFEVFLC